MILTIFSFISTGFSKGIQNQMIGSAKRNFIGESMIIHNTTTSDILWPTKLKSFSLNDLNVDSFSNDSSVDARYRSKSFSYSESSQMPILLIGGDKKNLERSTVIRGDLPKELNEIVITEKIAKKLNIDIGDRLAIEATTVQGYRNFDYFLITGIYKTLGLSEIMAGHIALVNIETLRVLKNDTEDSVTELVLFSKIDTKIDLDTVRISNWQEYGSLLLSIATTNIYIIWSLWILMMIIISVFLIDTIIAIIEERKREFGIMSSLGLGFTNTTGLVLGEIFALLLLSVTPGLIIGFNLIQRFSSHGIPITVEAMKSILGGFEKLYPQITIVNTLSMYFLIIIISLLVTLISLLRLRKLNVTEVMRI